jgi:hypothetical protein
MVLSGFILSIARSDYSMALAPSIKSVMENSVAIYLSSWLQIALEVWVSLRFMSFSVPVGVGVAATATGIALAHNEKIDVWFPWALPVMAVASGSEYLWWGISTGAMGGVMVGILACWRSSRYLHNS